MALQCGIVGLPNVGKSTLFNCLSNAKAQSANFPFCTIEPNVGVITVPDERLNRLAELVHPAKIVPTTVEIVDIAGLVKGASRGEGLGNKFLANIRETDAIIHVLRCFDDDNITHVDGTVDPVRDKGVIDTELQLRDLETVEGRIPRIAKMAAAGDRDAKVQLEVLTRYKDVLSLMEYRRLFGVRPHRFTGVDYVDYYSRLIRESGAEVEVVFANDAREILKYTKDVIHCDIHTRARTGRILRSAGGQRIFGLDEIMTSPVDGSGWNERYGLLGSNKATEDKVKLFPRDCQALVEAIQADLIQRTGKRIEVMVYGDGAFKDPIGKIWELADPVVSPAYTKGLEGTPNELKLKYLADNDFAALSGDALREAIEEEIRKKDGDLVGQMASEGTTPRRLTDLIGSLCDLTSGSGDKGTPIVFIQGYFDNYTAE